MKSAVLIGEGRRKLTLRQHVGTNLFVEVSIGDQHPGGALLRIEVSFIP